MAKKSDNFDKNFLITAALLSVGGAAALFMAKGSFADQLVSDSVKRREEFPEVPVAEVEKAGAMLQKSFVWAQPEINSKSVPLNKSVSIIMQDGELVDLYTEKKPLRPPFSNKYLRDNDLDYLSPNVGDLDPDADGYTNLEEFNGNTNPKDPKSTPPVETKLYFVNRVQDDYILKLQNRLMPAQVRRVRPDPARSVFIDGAPKVFGFDPTSATRFEAKSFEVKRVGETEVPQLTVMDNASKEVFVLEYNVEKNLAEYQAEMEFRLQVVTKLKVKKGDHFYLPKIGTKYLMQEVTEIDATVCPVKADGTPGKPFKVSARP
jgi:hypothetical protein